VERNSEKTIKRDRKGSAGLASATGSPRERRERAELGLAKPAGPGEGGRAGDSELGCLARFGPGRMG
jgi:hypothetical protein